MLCCASLNLPAAEYSLEQVKAAYLLKFLYFIDWPDQAAAESNQLVLCIINDEAIYAPLSGTDGRVINNQVTATRNITFDSSAFDGTDAQARSLDTLATCRVIFFGNIAPSLTKDLLSELGGAAKLTVSESDEFLANGGMINFRQAGSSLLFDISIAPFDRANMGIRSRLLNIADSVIHE